MCVKMILLTLPNECTLTKTFHIVTSVMINKYTVFMTESQVMIFIFPKTKENSISRNLIIIPKKETIKTN